MSNKGDKDRIGNYQLIKTIGEGTFGKVKLSIHLPTKEYVAIKILEKSKIHEKEELERVKKEIKYLKLLNHPNIIQIYEVIENSKTFYIVMEYVTGGELFNYIVKHETLSEKETSFFLAQIIYGVKEIHKKKICHRDIKPENLLLTEKKIIKIIDFGLSNEYTGLLNSQCGSPCYAAPEMIKGLEYDGLMVDLWSCGIILFAMLCGYLPFEDSDNNLLFRKIIQCKVIFLSEDEAILSNDAKDLIRRILNPDPSKRIKIDEILNHPFLKYGIQEYNNIMKPTLFNKDGIIIDYMVNQLNYSNKNNLILNLVKENKHNGYTTTYKLLKKKIIEGRFDYNYKKNSPAISPIRNIKVKIDFYNKENNNKLNIANNNNIKNVNTGNQNINTNLRKTLKKDNIPRDNIANRARSTDSTKNSNIKDLNIPKDKRKIYEDNAMFGYKNNGFLVKDEIKAKALYQELMDKNKNNNNFKINIDTSVSKEKKLPKNYNLITPPRYTINPITQETLKYYNNNCQRNIFYFPKFGNNKRKGYSADIIKPKRVRYIPNPLVKKIFGCTDNNMNLKIGKIQNGSIFTSTSDNRCIPKCAISADKAGNKLTRLKKNDIIINNYIYTGNYYNNNITNIKNVIISRRNNNNIRHLTPDNNYNNNYRRIYINDLENRDKNNRVLNNKNAGNHQININKYQDNTVYTSKIGQYKKIPNDNVVKNNYCTLQLNTINNNNQNIIKRENSNYNYTLNSNLKKNGNYSKNINYNNAIKTERNPRYQINNDKIRLRNQINNNNIKYIPIALREKRDPLIKIEGNNRHEKIKTMNIAYENNYFNKNNNFYLINNNKILNFNTNLDFQQIKNKLIKFCRNYRYQYYDSNNHKYIVYINNVNSFIIEIISQPKNRIIKLLHKSGKESITKDGMNKFMIEINNKI